MNDELEKLKWGFKSYSLGLNDNKSSLMFLQPKSRG